MIKRTTHQIHGVTVSSFPDAKFCYFVNDPSGHDMMYCGSIEERDELVKHVIKEYLDDGTWCEDVEYVTVGHVTGLAQATDITEAPSDLDDEGFDEDGNYWGDIERSCNYDILPLPEKL